MVGHRAVRLLHAQHRVKLVMRNLFSILAAAIGLAALLDPAPAEAQVVVRIEKRTQTMNVWVDGEHRHSWPVSTGRGGYATPGGNFRPTALRPRHYSSKYNNAPMHNAIFFHRGYAIHATTETGRLGRPASHGCVRLHPAHARQLYGIVQAHGPGRTRITVR
jgi:lipoprotein-anchoring transpeptidase ErfK/SrfK